VIRKFGLAIALTLALSSSAAAQLVYDFTWQSSATSSRDVLVSQPLAGGGVFPYQRVTAQGQTNGAGTLALTPTASGGFRFQFSGDGGTGFGSTGAGGGIVPGFQKGNVGFPLPAGVPDLFATPPQYAGGFLELQGDPGRPSGLRVAYDEAARSNTFCAPCWSVELVGSGTLRTPLPAAEPVSTALGAFGLVTAIALRSRRGRGASCRNREPMTSPTSTAATGRCGPPSGLGGELA
jgi:hypothetical protein